jgi:hypothetical protein
MRLGALKISSRARKSDLVADLVRLALSKRASQSDPIVNDTSDVVPAQQEDENDERHQANAVIAPPKLELVHEAEDDAATLPLGASRDDEVDDDIGELSSRLEHLQLAWNDSPPAPAPKLASEKPRLPLPTDKFHELLNTHVLKREPSDPSVDEPTVELQLAPSIQPAQPLSLASASPDICLRRPSVACSATPYHAHDALVRTSSGPATSTDGDDDDGGGDSSLSDFAQSPTEVLTDAARVRMRDEQSRGTSSGTILHAKANAPSITTRIVVVADTATAGADSLHAADAPPVSRHFPDLVADASVSPGAPTDFQSGRRVLFLNGAQASAHLSSALSGGGGATERRAADVRPFVAPRRVVVFPMPADESRHSSAAAPPPAATATTTTTTVWKARHAPLASVVTTRNEQPPTSSSSPEEPTVPLHLSDRELLVRTASSGTQRALLFESSSSSRTATTSAVRSDEVCKTVTSNGTESCDEAEESEDGDDDDDDEDDDDDGMHGRVEQFAQRQFESASSSPATPLRRRARRRVRRGRYRHAQRRQLPPSPLRRSLSAYEIEAAAGASKAAAAAPSRTRSTSNRALAVGDWRALRDPSGCVFFLNLSSGVVSYEAPQGVATKLQQHK